MLNIKSVMVTGASGKLGGPLCEALVAEGYHVIAADRRLPVGVDGVEEVQLDIADGPAVEAQVARSDAVIHLASCKEDREAVIKVSAQGHSTCWTRQCGRRSRSESFWPAATRSTASTSILSRSRSAKTCRWSPIPATIRSRKSSKRRCFRQYFCQAGVPTVCLRMSWIQAEDDILTHLTVAGEPFGVPVWSELMSDRQRADFSGGRDAAVALRHPDGTPMRRHIVAVEDCVQAYLLALKTEGIEGETFMIAMNDPFNYVEAAAVRRQATGHRDAGPGRPGGQGFLHRHDEGAVRAGIQAAVRHLRLDRQGRRVPPLGRYAAMRSGFKG